MPFKLQAQFPFSIYCQFLLKSRQYVHCHTIHSLLNQIQCDLQVFSPTETALALDKLLVDVLHIEERPLTFIKSTVRPQPSFCSLCCIWQCWPSPSTHQFHNTSLFWIIANFSLFSIYFGTIFPLNIALPSRFLCLAASLGKVTGTIPMASIIHCTQKNDHQISLPPDHCHCSELFGTPTGTSNSAQPNLSSRPHPTSTELGLLT